MLSERFLRFFREFPTFPRFLAAGHHRRRWSPPAPPRSHRHRPAWSGPQFRASWAFPVIYPTFPRFLVSGDGYRRQPPAVVAAGPAAPPLARPCLSAPMCATPRPRARGGMGIARAGQGQRERWPGGGRGSTVAPPLKSLICFFSPGRRKHRFREEVSPPKSKLYLVFWCDFLQACLEKCKDRICKISEYFDISFNFFDFSKAKNGKNSRK